MGQVVGNILPLALGVAISPIPIIAAILMLLSPRARVTSVGFLLGWVVGIIVAIGVFTALSSFLPEDDPDAAQPIAGWIKIILGALLLLLAWKQWSGRPREGEQAKLPPWMAAIDTMTMTRALGLGFLLSAVNPKNLLMAASAGVIVGSAGLSGGEIALSILIFVVIAAASVALPVIAYLLASEKMAAPLKRLRTWLQDNNATVMAVLLFVIGVVMVGKGIGSF